MNAALGLVQLEKQEILKEKRANIAERYTEAFSQNKNIVTLFVKDDRESSCHLYVIKVDNRDAIIEELTERGVRCSVHFIPVHRHPYYKERYSYDAKNYPVAENIFERSLSLPIFPDMREEEINYVIKQVLEVCG